MEASGFKGFPFQVIQHIHRPNIIWKACNNPSRTIVNFVIYLSVAYHMFPTGVSSNQSKVDWVICIKLRVFRGSGGDTRINSSQSSYASTIWDSNVSFSSSRTPKHLLEGTRETKLLSMEIKLDKSSDLVFKLYVDPTTINLVLRGCTWHKKTQILCLFIGKTEVNFV